MSKILDKLLFFLDSSHSLVTRLNIALFSLPIAHTNLLKLPCYRLTEDLLYAMDADSITVVAGLDFSAAFDTI